MGLAMQLRGAHDAHPSLDRENVRALDVGKQVRFCEFVMQMLEGCLASMVVVVENCILEVVVEVAGPVAALRMVEG
jgi:hypothetical protein